VKGPPCCRSAGAWKAVLPISPDCFRLFISEKQEDEGFSEGNQNSPASTVRPRIGQENNKEKGKEH